MTHKWTAEQYKFLKDNIKGLYLKDLTALFNKEFGLNLREGQVMGACKNKGYFSGVNTRFKKGRTPHFKGTKGLAKPNSGSFKKGSVPHNYLGVGVERINGDGYVDIKIADPNVWKAKHRIIWEDHHGEIPEGHYILFGDKDKHNFDINNLICISKKQMLTLNRYDLISDDTDLTKTGVIIADLKQKIYDREGARGKTS